MRNRKTLFASLFIAMFLCTIPSAFASVWYVKKTGDNAKSGATEALAKASIQAMLNSTSVVSGDTILVWGGNYQEQVVTGNLHVTIIGSQGGTRTVIQAPDWASMVSYTFVDAMNWNGVDKLSSNVLKPIVFANASSSSILTNIRGIDIDGSTANMPEGATEVFAGLAYRQSQGLIGGYGDSTYNEVRNITPTANTNALNNTVGVLFIERAKPTMIGTRIVNFRNIGIGSIGMNTSALQTVQDHQPSPIIINCIVQGEDGGTSSTDQNAIQAGLVVVNGARVNITKSHIYGNRSGNDATGDRIAYGIYMWNARNSLIGNDIAKANGNVISDNEIGIYVRITVSSFSPSLYTIRNNNIVYNGGTAANLGTPAGEVANYASAAASYVTDGAVRFSHSSNFSQTLNVSNNAWGNSEAQSVFSQSAPPYSLSSYKSNPVAFWRETTNDNITFTNPLSPATTVELNVNPAYAGSNASGAPGVDVNYGFTKFDQLNRAVYAAGIFTGSGPIYLDPKINLLGDVVENGTVIITKPVKIIGSGASCDLYPSVTLRDGLNEPTVWIYGMSATDGDYTDRTPVRDTLNKIRIMANNTQTSGGSSDGPAVLITGGSNGLKSPIKPVMSYMSISAEFDGQTGPQAYSTSQSGTSTLSKRYALAAAGPYYALYTRRPENCNTIVGGNNVIDQTDNFILPKFQFDNIIEVATCTELNTAIQAATGPDFTTMLIVSNIGSLLTPCEVIVNNTQPITVDVQTGSTAYIHYLLNPGASPSFGGASNAVCNFLRTTQTSGGTHNAVRVTAYPPACLQTAVNLISSGSDNLLVAAAGSAFTDAGSVTINKAFDFMGATNATAHLASPTAGNATYTGKFVLNTGADINNTGGSLTSTRGTTFGDAATNQVDLNFTNTSLANFGSGTGDAINMALQLIGTSGSRRMELTTSSHSTETPTISKRVYLNGLANRGTTVGLITLNGSGNCTDPSVLRNLSAATITVNSNSDCIQTALGIANCTTYTQNIEGVGTNATNGSGGTVNLNNVAYTQNVDISKSVTFTNSTTTTGTVTLRRGANLLGGLSNFAPTVNLEQCVAFANATKPDPQQAITIVNNSGSGIVNIAGYGEANSNDLATPAPNGVWTFSNIDVTKDIEIRGNYHNTSATDLTCANIAGSSLPPVNSLRLAGNETTIGAFHSGVLEITNPIFKINSNGVSIKGFRLRNVESSTSANAFVRIFGSSSNIEVVNNIISGSSSSYSVVGLVNDDNTANKSNIDVTNNYYSTNTSSYSVVSLSQLRDGASASTALNNVVSGLFGSNLIFEYRDIVNTVNNGLIVRNNWVNASSNSHGIHFWSNGPNSLNGILVEQNHFRGGFVGLSLNTAGPTGPNLFTVRENYIRNNATGVRFDNNLSAMTTNQIFVNNNNLESNTTAGIEISATTSSSGASTNFLDLRFNYWGSALGPVRGTNVATNPVFALSDSLRLKGHVPFEHTTGSKISDASTNGRWVIYPVAVSDIDGNSTCGWQYSTMMGPVLRVNGTGTTLLGMYPTITDARDNTNATFPATPGARSTSDQLVVVAGTGVTSYGTFGYPAASSVEPAYPIVFDASPEPSVIRGLNRPRIMLGAGATGSIKVESTYPAGVTVKDFIEHVATSGANVTMIEFLNPSSNTVDYNFFASSHAHTSFTGIRFSNSTNDDANNTQKFTNNRINLGRNPGWPGGPAITSAPSSFIGIEIADRGAFVGNVVEINDNEISTAAAVGTRSIGIDVNGTNISNFGNILRNTIRHMAAGGTDIIHPSKWGTGIYVTRGSNFTISGNNIAGGNSISNGTDVKGHDGITLDSPSGFTIGSASSRNNIGTEYNSLTQEKPVVASSPQRGYGIKVYSTTGTGNIVNVTIDNLVSGSNTTGCATAAVYVGGTTGTLSGALQNSYIYSTNAAITGSTTSSAAVQIGTSAYNSQMSSGNFDITNNSFGDYAGTAYNNTLDLAIGTSPDGNTRANCANNIFTNIRNNSFRDVAFTGQFSVADGRPFAGSNIRNIFGYTNNWSSLNGPTTAGQGNSGNNVFTHGAILTGERNLANYNVAMSRTANAQQTNPSSSTEPVKIWRLLQTPLIAAKSTDSVNTLELRENYNQTSGSNSQRIFNENLIFPDQRVLLLGPANGNAYIVPSGSTAVGITSTGRENKDIRGGINFWISGTQKYAEIPGSATTGAANKGDVYLQGATIGNDISYVKYYYAGTEVIGNGFSSTITADIKAGIDDADDNGAIPAGAMTQHRTGVFVRGNGTSFTKDNTNEAITGMNMLNVYPNPASGDVTVSFKVPVAGFVRVALYNALGQKVTDLREENLNADTYSTVFNAASLTNGTYHVRLVHDQFTLTTPVTIVK